MSIQDWLTVVGILIVIVGLAVSTYGAVLIYRADVPRNDWILSAVYEAASKPSYAVIAPSGYHPQVEREEAFERVRQLGAQTKKYEKVSKTGMAWIFSGFLVQVVGNGLMIAAYRFAGL